MSSNAAIQTVETKPDDQIDLQVVKGTKHGPKSLQEIKSLINAYKIEDSPNPESFISGLTHLYKEVENAQVFPSELTEALNSCIDNLDRLMSHYPNLERDVYLRDIFQILVNFVKLAKELNPSAYRELTGQNFSENYNSLFSLNSVVENILKNKGAIYPNLARRMLHRLKDIVIGELEDENFLKVRYSVEHIPDLLLEIEKILKTETALRELLNNESSRDLIEDLIGNIAVMATQKGYPSKVQMIAKRIVDRYEKFLKSN
jgi:uncharacterized protein with HEPN domain